MSHLECHRCGSREHYSSYGYGCGPMGAYTVCENCGCVLAHSPDTEGLDEEQTAIVVEASAALLAWHRLTGRQRWLQARRERRRSASKKRRQRKVLEAIADKWLRPGKKSERASIHVTTLTGSWWL